MGRLLVRLIGAVIALAIFAVILLPALAIGVLLIKLAVIGIVVSWLFRKVFGRSRRREAVLVGPPIADISAPRRDKYDIAAERELDRELGL